MCTIQRFSAILIFMPNICGGKLKYGNTKTQLCLCRLRVETYIWDLYKTKHFQFYTDICAKHFGGRRHISGKCVQSNPFLLSWYLCQMFEGRNKDMEVQKYSCCLCTLRARFRSEWGRGETDLWDVCAVLSLYSRKTLGRWTHISGMCMKTKISNSIPIFVSNIWQVEPYFWDFHSIRGKNTELKKIFCLTV